MSIAADLSFSSYRFGHTAPRAGQIVAQQAKTLALYGDVTGWKFRDEKSFALDSYPIHDEPPQTMIELRARLLQFFPSYAAKPCAVIGESQDIHFYISSHGTIPEGGMPPNQQIFFDEHQAVVAYWYYFVSAIIDLEFDRDVAIHGIYWREWPEINTFRGTWRVLSRQSFVYKMCNLPNYRWRPIVVGNDGMWKIA